MSHLSRIEHKAERAFEHDLCNVIDDKFRHVFKESFISCKEGVYKRFEVEKRFDFLSERVRNACNKIPNREMVHDLSGKAIATSLGGSTGIIVAVIEIIARNDIPESILAKIRTEFKHYQKALTEIDNHHPHQHTSISHAIKTIIGKNSKHMNHVSKNTLKNIERIF